MVHDSDIYDDFREFETSRWDIRTADLTAFQSVLASASNEMPLQLCLQQHPQLLCAYLRSGHGEWVIPQKRLGAEYVPDFVIGCGNSAGILWDFIELESPRASLVLANGQASRELRTAIHQVERWRAWLQDNLDYARRGYSQHGLGLREVSPSAFAKVVIGRRSQVSHEFNRLRQTYRDSHHIDVMTYDRLVEDFERMSGIIRGCRNDE
ncbi:MAG TPA: Shedu anti-phage system protein SduA domain-containing protein [Rhizomicrobium sp.]|jgi:hypothetical protein